VRIVEHRARLVEAKQDIEEVPDDTVAQGQEIVDPSIAVDPSITV
jgi:hypothetical protein